MRAQEKRKRRDNIMEVYKQILKKDFVLMIIAMIICGTAQMAVNTNVAAYCIGEIGVSQAQFGTIVAVAGLVATLSYPLIGILCDKMRHGVCGAIGAGILAASFLMYLVFHSFGVVMLCRCIQFFAFGFIINSALSIAAASVKKELRSAAMVLYGLGPALSYFTGPQTGTSICTTMGFPMMFKVCAVLAAIGGVVFLLNSSKPVQKENAPKKVAFGFEKTAMPGFLLSFLILQIVFISQSYATVSLLERGIAQAALFWSVGAVVNIIARLFITKLIDRIGINKVFYVAVTLLVIAVLCIALGSNLPVILLAAVCWGIGYNGTQACIMSVSVLRAPADRIGQANSTHQMGHNAAQIVWSQVAGIIAGILGYQGMFLCMLIPMAAGIVFFLVYVRGMVNRVTAEKQEA